MAGAGSVRGTLGRLRLPTDAVRDLAQLTPDQVDAVVGCHGGPESSANEAGPAASVAPPEACRFAELVREVPAVKHVAFARDGAALRFWSVTETYDREASRAIHARELALYDKYPGQEFDFLVLPLEGEALDVALPDGFELVWSRADR